MYGHSNATFPRADYNHQSGGDHHHHPQSPPDGSASPYYNGHLIIPSEYLEMAAGTSESSSYDSLSSLASCCTCPRTHQQPSLIQRSMSSHSLMQRNGNFNQYCYNNLGCVEFESSSVRRAMSTGDLVHGLHRAAAAERESTLSSESNAIIESMNKASKCSPDEKKDKIERYRTKRTQRNFNKKIKYACRKTLADSRPRVRGRFARNDEIEKYTDQAQWSNASGEEDDVDDNDNWLDLLNAFSANSIP